MIRQVTTFLMGLLVTLSCFATTPTPQNLQFDLQLDITNSPTVKLDMLNTNLTVPQLKLDKNNRLPRFESDKLSGKVNWDNTDKLTASLQCNNKDQQGNCILSAVNTGGACPACTIQYKMCIEVNLQQPICENDGVGRDITISQNKGIIGFEVYIKGDGNDSIIPSNQNEKFNGSFSITFTASF